MSFVAADRLRVDVHPAGWHFPAGDSWIAGWACPADNTPVTDLRLWLDHHPFLGLHGLPKPDVETGFLGRPGPPYAAFSFLVKPPRGARELRLEARDLHGAWHEIFRQAITVDPGAAAPPAPVPLATRLPDLLPAMLRLHVQRPHWPLGLVAEEALISALACPLNALPVPPFYGALEEPRQTGYVRYGRLSLTGWLAHRTRRITRITAQVDALLDDPMMHGLPRTDIDAVFADLPGRETSSFVGHVDLPGGMAVPTLLKVFAELDDGTKHLAFAQRFVPQVIAGADVAFPPASRGLLARLALALVRAGRRLDQPTGSPAQWPASLRAAWTTWQAEAPSLKRIRSSAATSPATPPTGEAAGPLRLLIVTHNLNFEGAPWFIFELARFLRRQPGITVEAMSPQEGPMRRVFEQAGIPVRVVDAAAATGAQTPEAFHAALARAVPIDWSQVDLVIANTMVAFWAVHLAAAAGKPSMLYIHESTSIRRFFRPLLSPALFPVIEEAFTRATQVVFTAEATRRVHASLDTRGHFHLLPSWVDVSSIDAFAATHAPAALRRKHGLDPDALLVVNIGSVCERKGQHVFIRGIELMHAGLAETYPNRKIHFVMVGARAGLYLDSLKQEIVQRQLPGVFFVPETSEIHDFYRLADIFVCTSFEESFPRVLLESAAYRLPIVTTNVNGIPEMLAPDEAFLIPPGDRHLLAQAMGQAIADRVGGNAARAERARAAVVRRFHESQSLPRHLALVRAAARRG